MKEFKDVGTLVESIGVVSVTCQAVSASLKARGPLRPVRIDLSSSRSVLEQVTYHPSSTCLLRVSESAGLFGHRLWKLWWSKGVAWKPAEVRRFMRSFVVFMIGTIAAASGFCEFVGEWAGRVSREDCYKLMAVGHLACEFIM